MMKVLLLLATYALLSACGGESIDSKPRNIEQRFEIDAGNHLTLKEGTTLTLHADVMDPEIPEVEYQWSQFLGVPSQVINFEDGEAKVFLPNVRKIERLVFKVEALNSHLNVEALKIVYLVPEEQWLEVEDFFIGEHALVGQADAVLALREDGSYRHSESTLEEIKEAGYWTQLTNVRHAYAGTAYPDSVTHSDGTVDFVVGNEILRSSVANVVEVSHEPAKASLNKKYVFRHEDGTISIGYIETSVVDGIENAIQIRSGHNISAKAIVQTADNAVYLVCDDEVKKVFPKVKQLAEDFVLLDNGRLEKIPDCLGQVSEFGRELAGFERFDNIVQVSSGRFSSEPAFALLDDGTVVDRFGYTPVDLRDGASFIKGGAALHKDGYIVPLVVEANERGYLDHVSDPEFHFLLPKPSYLNIAGPEK